MQPQVSSEQTARSHGTSNMWRSVELMNNLPTSTFRETHLHLLMNFSLITRASELAAAWVKSLYFVLPRFPHTDIYSHLVLTMTLRSVMTRDGIIDMSSISILIRLNGIDTYRRSYPCTSINLVVLLYRDFKQSTATTVNRMLSMTMESCNTNECTVSRGLSMSEKQAKWKCCWRLN